MKIVEDLEESVGTACVPIQADNRKLQTRGLPHHHDIHCLLRE